MLLLNASVGYAQNEQYKYKREIHGVSNLWHKIILPEEIFGKISSDFADIRILGITEGNDTIEAPYLLQIAREQTKQSEVAFEKLNTSYTDEGYYYIFKVPVEKEINQVQLEFDKENFDRTIKLEGNRDQEEWFTILDDYRVLAIKNDLTDYEFTKVKFPNSNYIFFRLLLKGQEKLELLAVKMIQNEISEGRYNTYHIDEISVEKNKETTESIIEFELPAVMPVSYLKINITDSIDYFRPISIKYLSDSVETQQGWKYKYQTLTSGTLNSLQQNEFTFSSAKLQKIKVVIYNGDNKPLKIDAIVMKAYVHELVIRFNEPAKYFMTYGRDSPGRAQYDIKYFANKIPDDLRTLEIGDEIIVERKKVSIASPIFENKVWLWSVMVIIIILLAWFSISMLRKK
ncbi:hypothetical protein GCM10011506_24260 [Marivirga lumbricoides]|uniref:DUF3999 domain-containing protein n=1 Tax=Marivirga lumbricoides TaxID=1046115 RepID=A0ABQ1MG23_9BACT|nr:hypothetical protein GCM10011506_24260 [Marivirga lumbricoides]